MSLADLHRQITPAVSLIALTELERSAVAEALVLRIIDLEVERRLNDETGNQERVRELDRRLVQLRAAQSKIGTFIVREESKT